MGRPFLNAWSGPKSIASGADVHIVADDGQPQGIKQWLSAWARVARKFGSRLWTSSLARLFMSAKISGILVMRISRV
ncbi:MAG: hypothetical protein PHO79_05230 [Desulfoplanes sp.]|nr:hypothetical protein [Desulfoplanes sp.]MDD4649404.1 hypothetical protein [Desulfoplanes sp.]